MAISIVNPFPGLVLISTVPLKIALTIHIAGWLLGISDLKTDRAQDINR
jgi:hypothetical protein